MLYVLALLACSSFVSGAALAERQSAVYDFGAGNTYCTCPAISGQGLVEVNAYLSGARNYFLDCQYGTSGEPCEYNTAGQAVNPPSYCPKNSFATTNTQYCYVTCPATVGTGNNKLNTVQSNVVILASGTSYTTCRYQNGVNCQFNPATGALSRADAGGPCPTTNAVTSGCCFTLTTSSGGTTPQVAPQPVSPQACTTLMHVLGQC